MGGGGGGSKPALYHMKTTILPGVHPTQWIKFQNFIKLGRLAFEDYELGNVRCFQIFEKLLDAASRRDVLETSKSNHRSWFPSVNKPVCFAFERTLQVLDCDSLPASRFV